MDRAGTNRCVIAVATVAVVGGLGLTGRVAAVPAETTLVGGVQARTPSVDRSSNVPRLYVATGSSAAEGLARLRAEISKLPGVRQVEAKPEFGAVTVRIEGDGSSTESLLTAGARAAGYVMRPAHPRYYAAEGKSATAEREELKKALEGVDGVEQVRVSEAPTGAAVQVLSVAPHAQLQAAGKRVGYSLQPVAAYVASGPISAADVNGLTSRIQKVHGVDRLEVRTLSGGATLLVRGAAEEETLVAAARRAGYELWLLKSTGGPRLFRVARDIPGSELSRLREALSALKGIGKLDLGEGEDGLQLSVVGGRVRADTLITAAAGAGFRLTAMEGPIVLPTVEPAPQRSTPPDFDQRVLRERAMLGGTAPPFKVLGMDGKKRISLAQSLSNGKPLVLIFGSCTCPRFMAACDPLEQLYQRY